jgi:hypothetical protein
MFYILLQTRPAHYTSCQVIKNGKKNVPTSQTSTISSIKPPGRREHTSSRRSKSSYRYASKFRRYRIILAGISILFCLVLIFSWLHFSRESSDHRQAIMDLRKQEVLTESLARELDSVKNERDILVQERIPGLIPLTYDEAITIDNEYVRNIIFTLAKSGKKNIYEYRLVLHNNTLTVAHPKAEIMLFNDIGIQIGMAKIEQTDATNDIDTRATLDPGEVRSYTAAINLGLNEEPSYFLLVISERSNATTEKLRQQLDGIISN